MMIHVENAVVIMLIGLYHYVFAEGTHESHSGGSRMVRKVYETEAKRRAATSNFWSNGTGIGWILGSLKRFLELPKSQSMSTYVLVRGVNPARKQRRASQNEE